MKKIAFAKRKARAERSILDFRTELDKNFEKTGKEANEARVGFDRYDDLLTTAKTNLPKKSKAKHLHTLFGVKILIDPSLKPNEIKLSNPQHI